MSREERRAGKRQRRDSIADSAFAWLRRDKCGLRIEGNMRMPEQRESFGEELVQSPKASRT